MTHKNLSQWLSYLETLHPKSIDLGLERVRQVAHLLGIQKIASHVVTVTGTNGKGTCVTSLASIYSEAGYQVGAYTSPHLWHFSERIAINGYSIDEEKLCQVFEKIEQVREDVSLTYFEFTTLAAFYIFQEAGLDIAILEVGMGGRLDAVNIIDPDVAVITTVSLDHQEWLGDTVEKIAIEKAGILRNKIPLVAGRYLPDNIYEAAKNLNCPVFTLGDQFEITSKDRNVFTWKSNKNIFNDIPKNHLLVDNIALSLMVVELLEHELLVSLDHIKAALKKCHLPGRQQVITEPVWQMFDVAHNPQGVVELSAALKGEKEKNPARHVVAVFSMLKDKDISACVKAMSNTIDEWHISGLDVDRGMSAEELGKIVSSQVSAAVHVHSSIKKAFEVALAEAKVKEGTKLVIFGSFHTVAQILI